MAGFSPTRQEVSCPPPRHTMAELCAECEHNEHNADKPFYDPSNYTCPGLLYSDCPKHIALLHPPCWRWTCANGCYKAVVG